MESEKLKQLRIDIQKIIDKNGGVLFKEQFEEANRNYISKEDFDNFIKKSQETKEVV